MNNDVLLMFLDPVNGIDSADIGIMRSYDVGRMVCIPYSYDEEMLNDLESEFDDRTLDYLEVDGRDDMDLVFSIRNLMVATSGKILVDVTFASQYHSALCMTLGSSEVSEIYYSRYSAPNTVMHERLDRIRHDYRDLPDTQYMVLDCISLNPMMTEQIVAMLDGKRSQSSIYLALNDLWGRKLIDKVNGKVPEGYSSRIPNFFRFNPDQQWDYHVYKHLESRRVAEIKETDRRQRMAKESKKNNVRGKKAPKKDV